MVLKSGWHAKVQEIGSIGMEKPDRGVVKSVLRASKILSCISQGSNGVGAISKESMLSKGTTHRLLKSLVRGGLVIQDPVSEKYFMGPVVFQWLSSVAITHQVLTIASLEQMHKLMAETNETVLLHVRSGLQRVCIEEIESHHNIRYTNGRGFMAPLHTGAAGKILLSELSNGERELLLNKMELFPITGKTIIERRKLDVEINNIKKVGYATSFGERVSGSACVSVAIKNYSVPVALSVLGPDNRFKSRAFENAITATKKASEKISKRLEELTSK